MDRSRNRNPYSGLNDKDLIQAFLNNDQTAFNKLVLKYQNNIFNLCYRFLGHYEDADDCAQDTFVSVYKHLKNFKFQSSFSTWLYRIAVNTCKNKLSSLEYRLKKHMFWLDKPGTEKKLPVLEIKDENYSPAGLYEKKEQQDLIQKAINKLPPEQKTIVILRDIEGLSYEEIVQTTKMKLGTVKSKLARAREALKNKLKGAI